MKTFSLRLLTMLLVLSLTTPVHAGFDPGFEPVETDLKGTSEPIFMKAPALSLPPIAPISLVEPKPLNPKTEAVIAKPAKSRKWLWWTLAVLVVGGAAAAAGGGGGGGGGVETTTVVPPQTGTVGGSW